MASRLLLVAMSWTVVIVVTFGLLRDAYAASQHDDGDNHGWEVYRATRKDNDDINKNTNLMPPLSSSIVTVTDVDGKINYFVNSSNPQLSLRNGTMPSNAMLRVLFDNLRTSSVLSLVVENFTVGQLTLQCGFGHPSPQGSKRCSDVQITIRNSTIGLFQMKAQVAASFDYTNLSIKDSTLGGDTQNGAIVVSSVWNTNIDIRDSLLQHISSDSLSLSGSNVSLEVLDCRFEQYSGGASAGIGTAATTTTTNDASGLDTYVAVFLSLYDTRNIVRLTNVSYESVLQKHSKNNMMLTLVNFASETVDMIVSGCATTGGDETQVMFIGQTLAYSTISIRDVVAAEQGNQLLFGTTVGLHLIQNSFITVECPAPSTLLSALGSPRIEFAGTLKVSESVFRLFSPPPPLRENGGSKIQAASPQVDLSQGETTFTDSILSCGIGELTVSNSVIVFEGSSVLSIGLTTTESYRGNIMVLFSGSELVVKDHSVIKLISQTADLYINYGSTDNSIKATDSGSFVIMGTNVVDNDTGLRTFVEFSGESKIFLACSTLGGRSLTQWPIEAPPTASRQELRRLLDGRTTYYPCTAVDSVSSKESGTEEDGGEGQRPSLGSYGGCHKDTMCFGPNTRRVITPKGIKWKEKKTADDDIEACSCECINEDQLLFPRISWGAMLVEGGPEVGEDVARELGIGCWGVVPALSAKHGEKEPTLSNVQLGIVVGGSVLFFCVFVVLIVQFRRLRHAKEAAAQRARKSFGNGRYVVTKELGRGAFGVVYLVMKTMTSDGRSLRKKDAPQPGRAGGVAALKVMHCATESELRDALREYGSLQGLQGHRRVVNLYEAIVVDEDGATLDIPTSVPTPTMSATDSTRSRPAPHLSFKNSPSPTKEEQQPLLFPAADRCAVQVTPVSGAAAVFGTSTPSQSSSCGASPPRQLCLVMKYYERGTLEEACSRHPTVYGSTHGILQFLVQVLDVIDYAHNRNIVHRDLKPANILLDGGGGGGGTDDEEELQFVVSDFGLARQVDKTTATRLAGTLYYIAPEQLSGTISKKSDVWSLGCICLSLARKALNSRDHDGARNIPDQHSGSADELSGRYEMECLTWSTRPLWMLAESDEAAFHRSIRKNELSALSTGVADLVVRMLTADAVSRPNALECLELAGRELRR